MWRIVVVPKLFDDAAIRTLDRDDFSAAIQVAAELADDFCVRDPGITNRESPFVGHDHDRLTGLQQASGGGDEGEIEIDPIDQFHPGKIQRLSGNVAQFQKLELLSIDEARRDFRGRGRRRPIHDF